MSRHIEVMPFECDVLTGLPCICCGGYRVFILTEACNCRMRVISVSLKVKISCAILSNYACNTSLEMPASEVRVILWHSTYLSKAL